jgi:hypothetical protein
VALSSVPDEKEMARDELLVFVVASPRFSFFFFNLVRTLHTDQQLRRLISPYEKPSLAITFLDSTKLQAWMYV